MSGMIRDANKHRCCLPKLLAPTLIYVAGSEPSKRMPITSSYLRTMRLSAARSMILQSHLMPTCYISATGCREILSAKPLDTEDIQVSDSGLRLYPIARRYRKMSGNFHRALYAARSTAHRAPTVDAWTWTESISKDVVGCCVSERLRHAATLLFPSDGTLSDRPT